MLLGCDFWLDDEVALGICLLLEDLVSDLYGNLLFGNLTERSVQIDSEIPLG